MVSVRIVGRLTQYRRVLNEVIGENRDHIHSHELGARAGFSAAQVRRDLMVVGYEGSPQRGYHVERMLESFRVFLDEPDGQKVALFGVGNLGRAILAYFHGRRPNLLIAAAFDKNPSRAGRVIHGCRCYPLEEYERVIQEERIGICILAVPAAEAQKLADDLVRTGVRGLLNFVPVYVRVPESVYIENVDMTVALEKVAYFTRSRK